MCLGLWAMLAASGPVQAQGALPIQFEAEAGNAAFVVYFSDVEILADETWYVSGRCDGAADPATVHAVEFSQLAELDVFITDFAYTADHRVCLANFNGAPASFWRAYIK